MPARNAISPPPNCFTHVLNREQPYFFGEKHRGGAPDGSFEAGTRVVLLVHDGGPMCRVVDGRGLYVEVEYDSLAEL